MTPRIVDLTRVIQPTAPDAERKFLVNIHNALAEIPGKERPAGEWYVMQELADIGVVFRRNREEVSND